MNLREPSLTSLRTSQAIKFKFLLRSSHHVSDEKVEKLQQLVAVLVRAYDEHMPLMVTFTRIGLDSVEDPARRAELKAMRRRFETTWEDVVRAGMDAGELRADLDDKLVAFGIIGMINWMYKWYAPGGRKSADDIAHTFNAMIRDGLAHDPQGRGAGMSGG